LHPFDRLTKPDKGVSKMADTNNTKYENMVADVQSKVDRFDGLLRRTAPAALEVWLAKHSEQLTAVELVCVDWAYRAMHENDPEEINALHDQWESMSGAMFKRMDETASVRKMTREVELFQMADSAIETAWLNAA
jgi:hypothetical protein